MIAVAAAIAAPFARATEEKEETLGDILKNLFVRPTPSPKPRKKKKVSPSSVASETPAAASETPVSASSSPEASASATGQPSESPTSIATPEIKASVAPQKTPTQFFDAVRPIAPRPGSRRSSPTRRAIPVTQSTPFPTITAVPEAAPEIPAERPMPSLPPITTSSPPSIHTPAPTTSVSSTPTSTAVPSPVAKKTPSAAISTDEISDSANYSSDVRKIVDLSLDLTGRNLGYKYVSADPKNGGMDSSGFIYYVLSQSGVKDVPRDAREQYIWVRKAGNFQAVLAQRDDTFELDGLKPGDLLFWAGNFGVSRDPEITQTMIYIGRDKSTNQRLMVGASESRSSKGQKKSGVGVFEFKVGRAAPKPNQESGPVFVGYGRIPK